MNRMFAFAILIVFPATAFAQTDCSEELAEIDRRIDSGNYPEMNVQLAKTMRDSLAGMCGMLDEATLAHIMDGIEEALPVKTEEEKLAERKTKGEIAAASRAARKEAEAEREHARPSSGLENVTRSGRSVASGFINEVALSPDGKWLLIAEGWPTLAARLVELRELMALVPEDGDASRVESA